MSPKPEPGAQQDIASSGGQDTPITVFSPGDEKLAEEVLRRLAPQGGAWNRRSTSAMQEAVIMMVDDEVLNIEMTEAFLADAGYQNFVHTSDAREALPMLRQRAPGVLLLDLSMPHVSGLEILEAMRQDPQLRHVPVIVLTASTDPGVKLQALSHGAMASSGDYERCIVIDGVRHGHLLDPRSGWPVRTMAAATVIAPLCVVAGSASTIAMLKDGDGPAWLADSGLPHLWVTVDGRRGGSLADAP